MELKLIIEVNDIAPTIELCGEKCKYLTKGICQLFNSTLIPYSQNKIDESCDGTLVYEKTQEFNTWFREKQCIDLFYRFRE